MRTKEGGGPKIRFADVIHGRLRTQRKKKLTWEGPRERAAERASERAPRLLCGRGRAAGAGVGERERAQSQSNRVQDGGGVGVLRPLVVHLCHTAINNRGRRSIYCTFFPLSTWGASYKSLGKSSGQAVEIMNPQPSYPNHQWQNQGLHWVILGHSGCLTQCASGSCGQFQLWSTSH